MFPTELLAAYLVAALVVVVAPGSDNILGISRDFACRSNRCQDDPARRGAMIRATVARAGAAGTGELTMTARVR
jgi:hypothetical protein